MVQRTNERRDEGRERKRVMVRYGVNRADRTAFTRNISRDGIQLKTNNVYPPTTTLTVEIRFPDRSFSMWAKVAWAKKVPPQLAHIVDCGMGLRFIEPPADWADYIAGWSA